MADTEVKLTATVIDGWKEAERILKKAIEEKQAALADDNARLDWLRKKIDAARVLITDAAT